jgi:(1->4)-alpha-D-glucan 1-alpha-D-glucosylmutase
VSTDLLTRLNTKLAGNWGDTAIEMPQGQWRNALTDEAIQGGKLRVADLLKRFPVDLLSWQQESS